MLNLCNRKFKKFGPNKCLRVPGVQVIPGVTKDEAGVPTDGFTVYLFDMTSGVPVLVQTQVSAGGGLYSFSVGPGLLYWAVDFKSGAPSKTGGTVQTLTGI